MTHALITTETVRRTATLGRLALTEAEIRDAALKLEGILKHFSLIQKIDTQGVPQASDMSGLHNIARADVPRSDYLSSATRLLELAPRVTRAHVHVQAVFE
ncbi:MAG: Asp-tRNA(Asn)/Glu-tRNA(Gln) amidotransferase subunit GatC [Candidatus Andersenbacteria bacterium]